MGAGVSLPYRPREGDRMKLKPLLGLALVALGLIAIVYATWTQDLDPKRSHHLPLSTIVGGVAIAGGIAVLLVGKSTFPRLARLR